MITSVSGWWRVVHTARSGRVSTPGSSVRWHLSSCRVRAPAAAARREAAALAGLRHPNILSVYDVLEDAEGVWLIEQWITGAPLSAVLAVTGKLRAIDALALIHGALHGLSYAHGRDVVHGDITPANILIDQSGTPMLVDFGCRSARVKSAWAAPRATWRPRPPRASRWISVPMCIAAVWCWPNCSPVRDCSPREQPGVDP